MTRFFTATLLLFGVARACAWDPAGHMLVDQVAWENTKPKARAKVTELVLTLEHTYNGDHAYNFVTAGCWMDDVRQKKDYAWSKWHYVNIPWTVNASAFALPAPPHVVWAIEDSIKRLEKPGLPPADAALAVAMLMHFVGDLHQPLHATDRNDRGGNGYVVSGVPFSDLFPHSAANLHTFWDKAFRFDEHEGKIAEVWFAPDVYGRPGVPGNGVIGSEAAKIIARFPREKCDELAGPQTAEKWAHESYELGCRLAYPAGEPPADTEARQLEPAFVHASRQIAERRVALAGYRLADLLNRLFP